MTTSQHQRRSGRTILLTTVAVFLVLFATPSSSVEAFTEVGQAATPAPIVPPSPTPEPTSAPEPTATVEPTPEPTPAPTVPLAPTPTPEPEVTPAPGTPEACGDPVVLAPTVSAQDIDFGTLAWDGSGYPTAQRDITISIQRPDENCSVVAGRWAIQISTSGLREPGGATIPANTIVYVGPSGDVPSGVTPAPGRSPLGPAGTMIASGNASVADGGTWPITLEFTPPSDTPPGAYTVTINVDVVSSGS